MNQALPATAPARRQPAKIAGCRFRDSRRAPTPLGGSCCSPRKRSSRAMDLRRRAWRISPVSPVTRAALSTPISRVRKIFSSRLLERWVGQRISEVNALLAQQESSRKASARAARALRANHQGPPPRAAFARIQALRHSPSGSARAIARAPAPPSRFRRRPPAPHRTRHRPHASRFRAPRAAAGFGALSSALSLEHFVDPSMVSDQDTRDLLGVFFDAILGSQSREVDSCVSIPLRRAALVRFCILWHSN